MLAVEHSTTRSFHMYTGVVMLLSARYLNIAARYVRECYVLTV